MEESKPAAAAPEPKPAPAAKPAAPAAKKLPDPVFNHAAGTLLIGKRYWPTELWADPWSLPRYRNGALMLAAIVVGGFAAAAAVGELGPRVQPLARWLAAKGVA